MSKETKKRDPITFENKFEVALAIRQNGSKSDDGYWTYNEGWSDERIAKEMGVTEAIAKNTRQKVGGPMRRGGGGGPLAHLNDRLAALEAKFEALDAEIRKHQPHVNGVSDKIAELRQHFAKN